MKKVSNGYSIAIYCSHSVGHGIVGVYNSSSYDVSWSGTYASVTSGGWTSGKTFAIEVHDVSGYRITGVSSGSQNVQNLRGPYSMSGGKYWLFELVGNGVLSVSYERTAQLYSVITSSSPSGGGSTSGGGSYTEGQSVTVTATPNSGYDFQNWRNGSGTVVSTNSSYTFTMPDADVYLTAYFISNRKTVTVGVSPDGAGTVEGQGEKPYGQLVQLTARPSSNRYKFSHYVLNGETIYDNPYRFTITSNVTGTAYFTESYPLYLVTSPEDVGTMAQKLHSAPDTDWHTGEGWYPEGTQVDIEALDFGNAFEPSRVPYYKFDHWEGGSTQRVRTVTSKNLGWEIKAYYILKHYWNARVLISPADVRARVNVSTLGLIQLASNYYKILELNRVNFDLTIDDSTYRFVKWLKDGEQFSNVPSPRFDIGAITDDIDHIVTYMCVLAPNTISYKHVTIRMLPVRGDVERRVNITVFYTDAQGVDHTDYYHIEGTELFDRDVQMGARITLQATGGTSIYDLYSFAYWTGDIEDQYKFSDTISIYVNRDIVIDANYQDALLIKMRPSPRTGGTINVQPPAQYMGNDLYRIAVGSNLFAHAIANTGYTFDHWTIDGHVDTRNPDIIRYAITKEDYSDYVAYFIGDDLVLISAIAVPSEGGYITGADYYPRGSIVTLTAIANEGYDFIKWDNGDTSNSITFTATEDITYKAIFQKRGTEPVDIDNVLEWVATKKRKRRTIIIK